METTTKQSRVLDFMDDFKKTESDFQRNIKDLRDKYGMSETDLVLNGGFDINMAAIK